MNRRAFRSDSTIHRGITGFGTGLKKIVIFFSTLRVHTHRVHARTIATPRACVRASPVVCFVAAAAAANNDGAAATAALRPEVPESKHRVSQNGATRGRAGARAARANHGRER